MSFLGFFLLLGLKTQISAAAPIVTSLSPSAVILSGGISVTVIGTGLTDTTQPKLTITGNYSEVIEVFSGAACTVITATSLVCPSPVVTLTKFQAAGYMTNNTSQLLNNEISFHMGVSWSGVMTWEKFGPVDVYMDPTPRMDHAKRTYTVWSNRITNIYGTNLDKYINDKSEYIISISNLKCEVTFLNSTFISCLLPTTPPVPNDVDNLHSLVVLTLGYFSVQLGRIWYRVPTFVNSTADSPQFFFPNDQTDTIFINGTNLMVAITSGSTYYIQVGQSECTNITLQPSQITCRPPDTQPLPLSSYPERDNYPQIVVTVPRVASSAAHQYTEHVGYVQYSNKTFTTTTTTTSSGNGSTSNISTDGWTRIGQWVVVALVFLLSFLLLFSMLCCFCFLPYLRRNRRMYADSDDRHSSSFYARNTSAHSSFRSYDSKLTGRSYGNSSNTHIESDGKRFYYVTEEKIENPARNFPRY